MRKLSIIFAFLLSYMGGGKFCMGAGSSGIHKF